VTSVKLVYGNAARGSGRPSIARYAGRARSATRSSADAGLHVRRDVGAETVPNGVSIARPPAYGAPPRIVWQAMQLPARAGTRRARPAAAWRGTRLALRAAIRRAGERGDQRDRREQRDAAQASQGSARFIVSAVRCRTRAAAEGRLRRGFAPGAPGAKRARPRRRARRRGQPLRDVGHAVRRGRTTVAGLPCAELADHVVGRQTEQSGIAGSAPIRA